MKKALLVLLLVLSACSNKPSSVIYPEDQIDSDLVAFPVISSLNMIMVGDAIVHSNVYQDAYQNGSYDFTDMLDLMKPVIEPYDLAFYNQETILGGKELGVSNYPRFNSPTEFGDAMVNAGFNLVSLANNHSNDTGTKAILNSNAYWKTKPAYVSGTSSTLSERKAINVYTMNHITFGFLAYTYGTNGLNLPSDKSYMINLLNIDEMTEDVKALRPLVDVLIVSVHIGFEYVNYPNQIQKDTARLLANLGVNIVIENHAHAIEPIEWIDDTLVYYALGNFLSGQNGTAQLIGLTSSIQIDKITYGSKTTIQLSNLKVDLSYTYNDSNKRNVKIIPWAKVTSKLLPDKAIWEAKYLKIVNAYGAQLSFQDLTLK